MQLLSDKFDSFGLDIGDRSIKAAYIKKRGSDFELKSYGKTDIPSNIFSKGKIIDADKFGQAILELLKSVKPKRIQTPYVHACLPETHTFIKVISINPVKESKLAAAIREELPSHIPMNVDDLYIDWHIISAPNKENANMRILVGAIPKMTSDSYTNALYKIGLKPISLQIEAEAILRGILPVETSYKEPLAVIDIGATRSSFICYDRTTIQFTVSMPISGNQITGQIMKNLQFTEEKAEQAKRLCGLDPSKASQAILKILRPAISSLASSIKRNSIFYTEHFERAKPIRSVVLCGGGANMVGLTKTLNEDLPEFKIYLGNPLLNLVKDRKQVYKENNVATSLDFIASDDITKKSNTTPEFSGSRQLSFATAIGLALANVT